jgi:hypothetical protein
MLNSSYYRQPSLPSLLSLPRSTQASDGSVTDRASVTSIGLIRHSSVIKHNVRYQLQNSKLVTEVTVVTDRLKPPIKKSQLTNVGNRDMSESKGNDTGAADVMVSTTSIQEERRGSNPTAALQHMTVKPVPFVIAKRLIERNHYLHTFPGGTKLAFGIFVDNRLQGAISLGAGPANAYSLVYQAQPGDCLVLTRLWLSDELPRNSESKVIATVLHALKRHTDIKFLVSYADPSQGHMGIIYQATNWLYTGLSEAMPLYDLGDGKARQSRSLAHGFGTHSVKHLIDRGVNVTLIPQSSKHRYLYFLDSSWRTRLKPEVLPYPRQSDNNISANNLGRVGGRDGVKRYGSPLIPHMYIYKAENSEDN